MRFASKILAMAFAGILLGSVGAARPRAQEQPSQDQPAPEQQKSEKQKKEKKKGGGFFSGLKAVSGSSSEQQEATRTAGSKTVGEGAQIGDAQPSAADRQAVSAMESYALPAPEVKKFQDDGKLKSK
jgi:hypothetical protein